MFTFGLLALTAAPRFSVPGKQYARKPAFVPAARTAIVNAQAGTKKAAAGLFRRSKPFWRGWPAQVPKSPRPGNHFAASTLEIPAPSADFSAEHQGIQMKTTTMTSTLPAGLPVKLLAAAAIILALLAIPQFGHAQGIVRGAQEGSREGNRIAGPVGGVVGGAVGAGVGGAMGAVKGVFGITDRGYRCRGWYDRYDRFHCYR